MDEKIVEDSMQIIMRAGDARNHCMNALTEIEVNNSEKAEEYMKKAKEEIAKAHNIQTKCIQAAVRGEEFQYNVLFAHAQDTLMTVYSEINIANHMIAICKKLEKKIK